MHIDLTLILDSSLINLTLIQDSSLIDLTLILDSSLIDLTLILDSSLTLILDSSLIDLIYFLSFMLQKVPLLITSYKVKLKTPTLDQKIPRLLSNPLFEFKDWNSSKFLKIH